jgi:hypothetical protein
MFESGLCGVVEARGAEGVAGPGGVGESGVFDQLQHAGWAGEAFDRCGKIGVGANVAGDEAAYFGQDGFEVDVIERAYEAIGLIAFEDSDLAARAEDAVEFGEAFLVVGKVAEAEGGGDEVDGGVGDGEMQRVGFDGDDVVWGEFFCAAGEHLVGEVDGEDWSGVRGDWAVFEEGHGHVAGAAAEVERDGLGVLEDRAEDAGGAAPHPAIEASREDVVGAVVGGCDGVEHLLNVRGGGLLSGGAFGPGPGGKFVRGRSFDRHRTMLVVRAGFGMRSCASAGIESVC